MVEQGESPHLQGRDFMLAICVAMGVNPESVRSIEIKTGWHDLVSVTFHHFAPKEVLGILERIDHVRPDQQADAQAQSLTRADNPPNS